MIFIKINNDIINLNNITNILLLNDFYYINFVDGKSFKITIEEYNKYIKIYTE